MLYGSKDPYYISSVAHFLKLRRLYGLFGAWYPIGLFTRCRLKSTLLLPSFRHSDTVFLRRVLSPLFILHSGDKNCMKNHYNF